MIRIVNCDISRYRSILSMAMDISNELNLIALCGRNNVGKTNIFVKCNKAFGMVILKMLGEIKFHGVSPFLLSVYSIP